MDGMKKSQEEIEGQITSQMGRLKDTLERLNEVIGSLREKLRPILRASSAEVEEKKEAGELVPLATQLRTRRIEVESSISQVENMLSRIEL